MGKWQKFDSYDDYRKDLYRRLVEKIRFEIGTGCWIWQGFQKLGYGMVYVRGYGNSVGAHRAMWIAKHGDPGELDVLHNCHNKLCISPLHLHLGTHKQNFKEASEAKALQGQWKTLCKRGHPLAGSNLIPWSKWRNCKICATGRYRMKLGWPEHLAFTVGKVPPGMMVDFATGEFVKTGKGLARGVSG
jgi:hypothetical protein